MMLVMVDVVIFAVGCRMQSSVGHSLCTLQQACGYSERHRAMCRFSTTPCLLV